MPKKRLPVHFSSVQMRLSTGGGDTIRLGGKNIEITESDFYGGWDREIMTTDAGEQNGPSDPTGSGGCDSIRRGRA